MVVAFHSSRAVPASPNRRIAKSRCQMQSRSDAVALRCSRARMFELTCCSAYPNVLALSLAVAVMQQASMQQQAEVDVAQAAKARSPSHSRVALTELVLPPHANHMENTFGGQVTPTRLRGCYSQRLPFSLAFRRRALVAFSLPPFLSLYAHRWSLRSRSVRRSWRGWSRRQASAPCGTTAARRWRARSWRST